MPRKKRTTKKKTETELKELDSKTQRKKSFTFLDRLKLKRKPQSTVSIIMNHHNLTVKQFVLDVKDNVFKYQGKNYVIIHELQKFNLSLNLPEYHYHEGYAVPFDNEVVEQIDEDEVQEERKRAFLSVTPHNVKKVIKMEYVKALAQATELNKYLMTILLFGGLTMLMNIIIIVLVYKGM